MRVCRGATEREAVRGTYLRLIDIIRELVCHDPEQNPAGRIASAEEGHGRRLHLGVGLIVSVGAGVGIDDVADIVECRDTRAHTSHEAKEQHPTVDCFDRLDKRQAATPR